MNSENEKHAPTPPPTWQELIDCCRPGSDDVFAPEIAPLAARMASDAVVRQQYERCQLFDAAVAGAFHDVPVPVGLADRLLASLAPPSGTVAQSEGEPANASPAGEATDAPVDATVELADRPPSASRRSLLRWTMRSVAAAAALLVLAVVGGYAYWCFQPTVVPADQVVDDALRWTSQVQQHPWRTDMAEAPLQRFPREPSLRAVPLRWQTLRSAATSEIVAYDLAPPGKSFVAQFTMRVSHARQFDLPRSLPAQPTSSTGGFCIGACYRDGFLYVLVVEGDAMRYRQYVRAELPVT
ncbi:MAG: hypothetical protein RIC55_13535 [Pirellulaceae bacterium]